jgi:glycyl-tRNA synthetase
MYAIRKYNKPKLIKIKRIVPKMEVIGPLFKDKAGEIKKFLENIKLKDLEKISVKINNEKFEIPKDCYDIVEIEEKQIGEKFIPHVIEPSFGIDRIIYCILEHNYHEIEKKGEEYRILKLNNLVSPIKVGVLPLVSDNRLINIAKEINKNLRNAGITTYYDEGGTIGRRYARMDEIGTPFCITVDHDTLEDKSVTIRNRDTTKQIRKKIENIIKFLNNNIQY